MPPVWRISPSKSWSFDRPRLLAILNLTPDSFSDGGELSTPQAAADAARRAIDAGADGLDLGGESTRPGSLPVPAAEQVHRVVPGLSAIRRAIGDKPVITIDTTLSAVAAAALDTGADAVNDTSAGLDDPAILALCAARRRGIILMHRLRPPREDVYSDRYPPTPGGPEPIASDADIVHTIGEFLARRALAAIQAGIPAASIVLDPGLGFGKTVEQNLELIRRTSELAALGYPILSGLSRKSFVGRFMSLENGGTPKDRVCGSVDLSLQHLAAGASIFRVHDVAEHAAGLNKCHE
ncbi:MAG: dihydropteroate synthase [Phycisphaerales bacterium]